jgi:hypothetical protein
VGQALVNKKYATIEELNMKFTPLIRAHRHGAIDIVIQDKRKTMNQGSEPVTISLLSDVETEMNISGFEWQDAFKKCQFKMLISVKVLGLASGVKIGELKIIPRFRYTNESPTYSGMLLFLNPLSINSYETLSSNVERLDGGGVSGVIQDRDEEVRKAINSITI